MLKCSCLDVKTTAADEALNFEYFEDFDDILRKFLMQDENRTHRHEKENGPGKKQKVNSCGV